jgi:SAM-dependent methyltransferase
MSRRTDTLMNLERHLERCAVSLKPNVRREGVDAWFPYYAGYSAGFVREALNTLGAQPGWTVLDPWNGAGTTTAVADALGCDAVGLDINPVAALVAAARLERSANTSHAGGLAKQLLDVASRTDISIAEGDPLLEWLSPRVTRRYRRIESAVLALLGAKDGVRVNLQTETPPPFAAFFILCLVRAAKRFARMKENSNPTWITPERRGDTRAETFDRAFLTMVTACAADAEKAASERSSTRSTVSGVSLADARALSMQDASVDAVITSPPYCTRIDYFRATAFELAALGIGVESERFRALRSSAMGTNLMRTTAPDICSQPRAVRHLLQRIKQHPSKASDTYYFKHYAQYFDDARLSVSEIGRVLKPEATALLVVQSSYYKDIPVPLGELYAAVGEALGLRARVVLRVPVRRVLATINPRAMHHESERRYSEDVVALQRVA